jgi:hypothetical protein
VTRGTRPNKSSSSRGFAHGAWGTWGLKTENQKKNSPLFEQATTTKFYFILFFFNPTGAGRGVGQGALRGVG